MNKTIIVVTICLIVLVWTSVFAHRYFRKPPEVKELSLKVEIKGHDQPIELISIKEER